MTVRRSVIAALGFLMLGASAQADPVYTYVGSWHVGDGPVYYSNPPVYNGLEVAALLFGGLSSDYAISTNGTNPNLINFKNYMDGWGDGRYLYGGSAGPAAQNYSLDSGAPGYNSYPSFSAYVLDHTCSYRYSNPNLTCGGDDLNINYAFRVSQVPEPATLLLVGSGIVGIVSRRRRS